jgi:nitrogen fixation NifU-like protein
MEDEDGFARITGPYRDTVEIWLRVRDDIINEATFVTDDCCTSHAAGSMTMELAKGKP